MPTTDEVYESDWINHAALQGKRVNLTIRKVTVENAFNKNSFVFHFDETEKKFRVNKTNARMMEMLTNSADSDDWEGVRITLKPDITSYGGEAKKTVSIDSELPKQKPKAETKPADSEDEEDEIPF